MSSYESEQCPACSDVFTFKVDTEGYDDGETDQLVETCPNCGAIITFDLGFEVSVSVSVDVFEYELPPIDTPVRSPEALEKAHREWDGREQEKLMKKLGIKQETFT